MERNLGLCEGCSLWSEYEVDPKNAYFNDICHKAMLAWYKRNNVNFADNATLYKRKSEANIKEAYRVARDVVQWIRDNVPYADSEENESLKAAKGELVMEADATGTSYTLLKAESLFINLSKTFSQAEMSCTMLYHLLKNLDASYAINESMRLFLCEKVKSHFKNRDTGFFNELDRLLHRGQIEEERLKHCINLLLAHRVDGELLFIDKARWREVFDVLVRECIVERNVTEFVRFIERMNPIYADEGQQRITRDSTARKPTNNDKARKVRELFTIFLYENGVTNRTSSPELDEED